MNKKRRQEITGVYAQIQAILSTLNELIQEEQDAYDSIPDNLKETDRAEESEEAIDNLEDAAECLEDAIDAVRSKQLKTAKGYLEESLECLDEVI